MANNATLTAFAFNVDTPEHAEQLVLWLHGKSLPDELKAKMIEASPDCFVDDDLQYTIVEVAEFDEDQAGAVYANIQEGGDFELLSVVLSFALDVWPEAPSPQGFAWANTCSAMRIGEFSGGAMVVRRGAEAEWMNTSTWLMERLNAQS